MERERHWKRLESLVDRIEGEGLQSLSYQEVQELGGLYRLTVSSFTVLRDLSLDRSLIQYLRQLVKRAYLAIYHYDTCSTLSIRQFYQHLWPGIIRKHVGKLYLVMSVFFLCMITTGILTSRKPVFVDQFVSPQIAQGRNSRSSTEKLKESLTAGRKEDSGTKFFFSMFLFRHNTKIGILSFAIGVAGGIPAVVMGAYNAVPLGALAGLYHHRGLGYAFWAWLLPHGITELLAVFFCIQAGLIIGLSLVRPSVEGREKRIRTAGKEAGLIVLGTVPMFFLAGLIEGVLRQSELSWTSRYLVAFVSLMLWLGYLGFSGNQPVTDERKSNQDLVPEL